MWTVIESISLWRPQRFAAVVLDAQGLVQIRVVKDFPEMIDDLGIGPKLICKHKFDRSQYECEKRVVAMQQRGLYRRGTDEIA